MTCRAAKSLREFSRKCCENCAIESSEGGMTKRHITMKYIFLRERTVI